jgi:hypothetical protein
MSSLAEHPNPQSVQDLKAYVRLPDLWVMGVLSGKN